MAHFKDLQFTTPKVTHLHFKSQTRGYVKEVNRDVCNFYQTPQNGGIDWSMLDWDKIIDSDVKQALNSFGFPPTLRAMHYRLYSLKVIPNTRSSYASLSNNTARARESGILPIDCFSDDTRQVICNFPSDFDYEEPETHVNRVVNVLRDFPAYYKNRVLDGTINHTMWKYGLKRRQ